jgi:hypothetical protein
VLTRLRQKVQFAVTAVQVELETNPEVIVIPCPDRAPQDPSEFNPIIVDALNGHRVLIELWGRIEALSGLNLQRAVLNYTVVPVSQYDRSFIPQGGFATKYQRRLRETPDDLAKIFGEFSDLKTYMSIAAGVKSLKEHSYDQAYKSLCQADSLLAVTPASIEPALRATLRTYVARKLGDTIAGARADKSAKTALALDGVLPTCPSSLP